MSQNPYEKARNVLTELQSVTPPFLAADGTVRTGRSVSPLGVPAIPPRRHPGGPSFGYVLEGEMVFELQGEPPRVVKAGEAFWEPGGDVIPHQDANNRTDIPLRFVV